MLKSQQTQKIYALAARLDLVESGNKNDLLHEYVFGKTQKTSVRELTDEEYTDIIRDFAERFRLQSIESSKKKSVSAE